MRAWYPETSEHPPAIFAVVRGKLEPLTEGRITSAAVARARWMAETMRKRHTVAKWPALSSPRFKVTSGLPSGG